MVSISSRIFIRFSIVAGLVIAAISGALLAPQQARANVPPSCSVTPLFTNGTFITGVGNGSGGADTSAVTAPDTGNGYLVDPTQIQGSPPDAVETARLADDFTVSGNGWRPSAITLYAYQIDSGTTSTINGVIDLRLWNGVPGAGGTVVQGPVSGTITNNAWTNVYRVPSTDLTQTSRPIMAVTINWPFGSATLPPGTYWLEWGMTGTVDSGPWVPSTTATSGNARQLDLTGGGDGVWAQRLDYGSGDSVDLPFVVCGSAVPTPAITTLSPTSTLVGTAGLSLTVNGSGFINGTGSDRSIVYWNGSPRTTAFVNSDQLTATILPSDLTTAGTANVTVVNPGTSNTSNTATFTINNPAPTTIALGPDSTLAGGPQFTLTITGTGFVNGSVVRWNGSNRTTTYVSATRLTATIPATDIATAGTANVTVFNATPGGGTSSARTFTINNPTPAITTLGPDSTTAGGPQFTLTITGTGFVNGSVVRWNGSNRTTTYVSATQLTATIPATDIATAGTANVTVFNATPGGGTSGAQTFTINNPAPTLSSIGPTSAIAGGPQFTLTITGTNFVNGSVVRWNDADRTTTYVSATQLTATIPATDIATAGTANVTVFNATPGGGETSVLAFTINNPAPTIASLNPDEVTAGSAQFTLTINGTGFNNDTTVQFGTTGLTINSRSATQLEATVPASLVTTAGAVTVTVANPGPGGGSDNETFTVLALNPQPVVTSVAPLNVPLGSGDVTITISGANFLNSSVVRWNGVALATTFVSNTELTATLTATQRGSVSDGNVTVFTPAPGGGVSAPVAVSVRYHVLLPLVMR